MPTRFGFDIGRIDELVSLLESPRIHVTGIHFHLDGYDAGQRVSAILQSLSCIDTLRHAGHSPRFLDMGGGFPMCYLESECQWNEFWHQHELSLLNRRDAITYRRHRLGLSVHDETVFGSPNVYPYYQEPTQTDWLNSILSSEADEMTIAERLRESNLQLRCEPGRSLLDGCGLTVARVEFTKIDGAGDCLVGLSMNRTQCRTTTDDFLVDPIVIRCSNHSEEVMEGYLVGAYCTESELISLRKMRFPRGIARDDLVVFPNTAGYLMHFLESRSHQFDLAKNLVYRNASLSIDPIDLA